MIARLWSARSTKTQSTRYLEHFWQSVVPSLRTFHGYVSSSVLIRSHGEAVEILVTTVWQSLEAIDAFAGPDRETAVVANPKFHEVPESILLIRSGIARNSLSGYWERPN